MKRAKKAGNIGIPVNKNENPHRVLYSAETIEELAEYVFADENSQKQFIQTVERYNQMCRDRKDIDFGKEPALLHEIKTPPFYAVGQLRVVIIQLVNLLSY